MTLCRNKILISTKKCSSSINKRRGFNYFIENIRHTSLWNVVLKLLSKIPMKKMKLLELCCVLFLKIVVREHMLKFLKCGMESFFFYYNKCFPIFGISLQFHDHKTAFACSTIRSDYLSSNLLCSKKPLLLVLSSSRFEEGFVCFGFTLHPKLLICWQKSSHPLNYLPVVSVTLHLHIFVWKRF